MYSPKLAALFSVLCTKPLLSPPCASTLAPSESNWANNWPRRSSRSSRMPQRSTPTTPPPTDSSTSSRRTSPESSRPSQNNFYFAPHHYPSFELWNCAHSHAAEQRRSKRLCSHYEYRDCLQQSPLSLFTGVRRNAFCMSKTWTDSFHFLEKKYVSVFLLKVNQITSV